MLFADNNTFTVTCELAPPKGSDIGDFIKYAMPLHNKVNAINITDGQGGNMRMNSIIASYLLEQKTSIPSICQLVCRDKNQIAIQADILGAEALGLKNFLLLSGDKACSGDHPLAKDVFDLNTDSLIRVFKNFKAGLDLQNNVINSKFQATIIGAAAHPGVEDLKAQALKMKQRIEEGVKFFQTQIVYDENQLQKFLESIEDIKEPVLIGITPLKSLKMGLFMNEKVFGVKVPDYILERMAKAENQEEEGLKIAKELIFKIKEWNAKGIHIMAIGQENKLGHILTLLNPNLH